MSISTRRPAAMRGNQHFLLFVSLERLEGESLSFANRITLPGEVTGKDGTSVFAVGLLQLRHDVDVGLW
jgi:hypothetical protein